MLALSKKLNKKKILVRSFIVILLGGGVALLLKSQLAPLRQIQVEVNPGPWSKDLSESIKKHIFSQIEPFRGQSIWTVNLNDVVKQVQSDRRIREVRVQRRLPSRMELKVELHQPLALLMGFKGELLSVSRDASVLPPMGETMDLPILRGVNFHKEKELRVQALEMLEEISAVGLASHQSISEIRFDKKFGYVLYLLPHGVRVRLGKRRFAEKMSRVERVINYLENQDVEYRVIDARFLKKVVVKPRNDP